MALPGIGDAYADKIIAGGRTRRSRSSVEKIVPEATYKQIVDKVIATSRK